MVYSGIRAANCRGESCIRPDNITEQKSKGEHKVRPYGTNDNSLGRIIQGFKSLTTHRYIVGVKQNGWLPFTERLWHRNYYEHIIRNEKSLEQIREYIEYNASKWETDEENPKNS